MDELLGTVKNLLLREQGHYETLRRMVSKELEAILLNSDMEELLTILEEKQNVISSLQLLADAWADALPMLNLEDVRGSDVFWEKLSAVFSEEESKELKELITVTRAMAKDLMEAEASVQAELEKHVRQLRERMLQMKHARTAVTGYAKMGGGRLDSD
ncbi:hypothetical protein FACS1894187_15570 [Synergistales bacterium]|nr:hypothetical protein FACS1894187_15570 [Synergistales bacterium]